MTIENNDLAEVYYAADNGELGHKAKEAAEAVNAAYDAVRELIPGVPGDDRAENFVHKAFAFALEGQGMDWRVLVDVVWLKAG